MVSLQSEVFLKNNILYTLPTEIWEVILAQLTSSPRSMVAASEVCKQWRHLVARLCQKYCLQHFDEQLLTELLESAVIHEKCQRPIKNGLLSEKKGVPGEEWISLFWLNHETELDPSPEKDKYIFRILESIINITTADPYLIVSSYNRNKNTTTVHVISSLDYAISNEFNEENQTAILLQRLNDSFNFEVSGKVYKTCIVNLPIPVIVVITTAEVKAVVLSPSERHLVANKSVVMSTNPVIKGHPKTSAEGKYLLTQGPEDEDYLILYEASFDPLCDKELNLFLKFRFKTEASAYSWILSRGMITTMETSGHIRKYRISGLQNGTHHKGSPELKEEDYQIHLSRESILKKDLRYPNPTLFTKDFLFSSTLVSRDLLGYWHMDRDRDYWLIGGISPQVLDNKSEEITSPGRISLQQVMLGQEMKQVVTTVYFERGILLCGTKEGHLLCYKMRHKRDFDDENSFKDLTGKPWFSITGVTVKSITRLGCLFTPFGVIVAVGEDTGMCLLLHITLRSPL